MYRKGKSKYRGVEQLEARRAHNPEVAGSSPASATTKKQVFNLLFYFKMPSNSLFAGIMQFTKIFKQSQTLFYLAEMAIKLNTKAFINYNKTVACGQFLTLMI